ncbi:hypothetical protein GCM10020295_04780 [Streptomyces cinereospinus]
MRRLCVVHWPRDTDAPEGDLEGDVGADGDERETAQPGVGLTTGEVARRLGVAPTTVRTWDRRYGLGPDLRSDGRHRRWTVVDVARLERMCALTATGLPPAEAARIALGEGPLDTGPAGQAGPRRPGGRLAGAHGPVPAYGSATSARNARASPAPPSASTATRWTSCSRP